MVPWRRHTVPNKTKASPKSMHKQVLGRLPALAGFERGYASPGPFRAETIRGIISNSVHATRQTLGVRLMPSESALLISGISLLLIAGVVGLISRKIAESLTSILCALGSLLILTASLFVLMRGNAIALEFPLFGHVAIDRLSAVFTGLIGMVALMASIYAVGYNAIARHSDAPWSRLAYCVFLLTMVLVVMARNVVGFLFAWELMALSSYLLVVSDVRRKAAARAGILYLVMTHGATACLVVAFFLWSRRAGSTDFRGWAAAAGMMPLGLKSGLFALLLGGFAAKAGAVPLHIWLPEAHPAAPSHVSALMSGAMLKTAVYGLIRFGIVLLPGGAAWWGIAVLLIGSVSAVLGALYAVVECDLKRLLAYSSVENVGIIFVGVGVTILARHYGLNEMAGFALSASLFHAVNHSLFKGLLFLNAGSIVAATDTRSLDRMGGLIRAMPMTAASFLVGAAAISALPPFNGFASEWATFQALTGLGWRLPETVIRLAMPLAASGIALTGALAAYAFVKAYGSAFLGLPRSSGAGAAREVGVWMWAPPAIMSVVCVLFGLFPGVPFRLLSGAVTLAAIPAPPQAGPGLLSAGSRIDPAILAGVLAAGAMVVLIIRAVRRSGARRSDTWNCGYPLDGSMEYSSMSFSQPAMRVFERILMPRQTVKINRLGSTPFAARVVFEERLRPVFRELIYYPLHRALLNLSRRVRKLQNGLLQVYLLYIMVTLVILLILARL